MTCFSIALPIYNVEKYIGKCLNSLINQTFTDFEVICVNDCSTDNTLSIIEEFAQRDRRIKVINHQTNLGVSNARNRAMDEACGEYLVWVDPDDWVEKDLLETLYNKFQETKSDVIWYNSYRHFDQTGSLLVNMENHQILKDEGYYDVTPENMDLYSDYVWDKAIKLSKVRELNIRFPSGLIFEDAEYYYKIYTQITRIYYLPKPMYYYRVREGSIVTNGQKGIGHVWDMFDVYEHIVDYSKEKGIFHDYRVTLLKMLSVRVNSVRVPNQKERVVRRVNEILQKIDFPSAFVDLENNEPDKNIVKIS